MPDFAKSEIVSESVKYDNKVSMMLSGTLLLLNPCRGLSDGVNFIDHKAPKEIFSMSV